MTTPSTYARISSPPPARRRDGTSIPSSSIGSASRPWSRRSSQQLVPVGDPAARRRSCSPCVSSRCLRIRYVSFQRPANAGPSRIHVRRHRPRSTAIVRPWRSRRATSTGSSSTARRRGRVGRAPRRLSSPRPASRSAAPRWRARPTSTARSRRPARRSTAPWGKTPPNERARLLHALADAIVANRKELAELESRNVGKAISSVKAEVGGAVENFRFFASVARLDRRPLEPDRRLAAHVLAEGAGRRLRADRARGTTRC